MRSLSTITLLLVVCLTMSGQTIDVLSSPGIWTAATPAGLGSLQGLNTASLSWGVGNNQSGYDYSQKDQANVPLLPIYDVQAEHWFQVGTFTHRNFPIQAGTSITSATLDITLNMVIPAGNGNNVSQTFTYLFNHNETPNTGGGCCNDIVTIVNQTPNQIFTINDIQYTLALGFGFVTNDVLTVVNSFSTVEGQANFAGLYGRFTTNVVPEPGFYGLLGIGLAGLYTMVRRRKQA